MIFNLLRLPNRLLSAGNQRAQLYHLSLRSYNIYTVIKESHQGVNNY